MHKVVRKFVRELRRDGYKVASGGEHQLKIYAADGKTVLTSFHPGAVNPQNEIEYARQRLAAAERGQPTGRRPYRAPAGRSSTLKESLDTRRNQ